MNTYIETIKSVLQNSEELENGFNEIEQVFQFFSKQNKLTNKLNFDLKLARGLNYYTGLIIEVVAQDSSVGSLGGGGRYDELVSLFNFKNVSGPLRESNPRPLAPKARIIPLDQAALYTNVFYYLNYYFYLFIYG